METVFALRSPVLFRFMKLISTLKIVLLFDHSASAGSVDQALLPCVSGNFLGGSSNCFANTELNGSPYNFFPLVQVQPNEDNLTYIEFLSYVSGL